LVALPQADPLAGIHLPTLMGHGGPIGGLRRRPPPRWGGSQAFCGEPALHGALRRQVGTRVVAVQEDADQAASPSGVLPPQGEGLVAQGVAGLSAAPPTGAVGRGQGLVALLVEALE
jgi:hypothetical protein